MPATKTRTLRLTHTGDSLALVIHQQEGRQAIQVDAYFLTVTPDMVVFGKHDGTRYEVRGNACSCPGHKHYGHKTVCKHVAAVAKLTEMGKI